MNFHHLINNKTKVSIYQKHSRSYCYLKRFYLFIFRERGREGERAGEKLQCEVASHMPPTGDLAHNPGMCPDWESNLQPCGSQSSTQSAEPHQPGLKQKFLTLLIQVRF